MTRKIGRRHWWDWPLKIILWAFILGVVLIATAIWKDGNISKETEWAIFAVVGLFALNYASNALGEKLDAILWKLEDIERRLPPEPEDHWQP